MRRIAAIAAAKATAVLSQRLRLGGGTALPGLVAERIDPEIVAGLSRRLGQGCLIVTGTNGKTTTARLVRGIAQAGGLRPVANRAGSNLMRGLAAALAQAADFGGEFAAAHQRIGVFEVDEATLPEADEALSPRVVAFTNLFRDQLDRYGEVEHVAEVWRRAVAALPPTVTVVLNADDPSIAALARAAAGRVLFYGLDDPSCGVEGVEHAADARWCAAPAARGDGPCGGELTYAVVYYGHLGHWRCPQCGASRPEPAVSAVSVREDSDGIRIKLALPGGGASAGLPLVGLYNAYNALAAAAVGVALELAPAAIEKGLSSATAAFGRQEKMTVGGRQVQVILAKNPAGLNQVLRAITGPNSAERKSLALFLNDNIADGRDVSWIWDVDFELLAGKARSITVSGVRAWDMALRLKYAGLYEDGAPRVEPDSAQALKQALGATPQDGTLYVIPTYTAMLQVRDLLARWAGRGSFWEAE